MTKHLWDKNITRVHFSRQQQQQQKQQQQQQQQQYKLIIIYLDFQTFSYRNYLANLFE